MRQRQRLEDKLEKQLAGTYYGNIVSFFRSEGLELHDMRQWGYGDSARHINWRASAKQHELWINTYLAEKDARVDIFLDINANWLGGRTQSNRQTAQDWLCDFILFARQHHLSHIYVFFPENGGLTHMQVDTPAQRVRLFEKVAILVDEVKRTSYQSNLGVFIDSALRLPRKRVLLLFSDFLDMSADEEKRLHELDRKHVVGNITLDVPRVVGRNFDCFTLQS